MIFFIYKKRKWITINEISEVLKSTRKSSGLSLSEVSKDLNIDDKEFDKVEAIICSMTKQEKRNVKILNGSRRLRIAKGSGTQVQDVNKFINSFEMTQKMMKKFKNDKGSMRKMMKSMNMDDMKEFKDLKF